MNRVSLWRKTFSRTRWLAILFATVALGLVGCGADDEAPRRVGILDFLGREELIEGFKAELADAGYVEGENVTYVIERAPGDLEGLGSAAERLMAADVELIFAISTTATIEAKRVTAGHDLPIVFAPVNNPVDSGLIESLREPGGPITGVMTGGSQPKLLEWFIELDRDDHTVLYVPHQPNDGASVQGLKDVTAAAELLGIELIVEEVESTEEIQAGIANASADIDGVISLPSGFFSLRLPELLAATQARGWPLIGGTRIPSSGGVLGFGALVDAGVGRQAGGLAVKILDGRAAGDLPVETSPFSLIVNLAAAETIGLDLPPGLIAQADVRILD